MEPALPPTARPLSETHARAILEHTPNGVLLVDGEGTIRFANPAFRRMFRCGDADLIGKPSRPYLRSDCFERAMAAGGQLMTKETIPDLGISFRAGLFPIEDQDLYCGIFIDISEKEHAREQYRHLRAQTLQRTQEVIVR